MTVCSQVPVLGWLKELCGHWNCLPSDEVLDSNWPFSYLFYRIYVDFIPLEVELQPLYLSTMWSKHSLYSNRPLTPPLETSLPPHALVSVWPPHLSPIGMLLYSPPCTKQGAHSIPGIPSCYLMLLIFPQLPFSLEESQSCSASMHSSSWSGLGLFPPLLSPVLQMPRIPSYRVDHMLSSAHTLSYLLYASNVLSLILLKGFFSLVKMQFKYHLRSCLPTLAGSSSILLCVLYHFRA